MSLLQKFPVQKQVFDEYVNELTDIAIIQHRLFFTDSSEINIRVFNRIWDNYSSKQKNLERQVFRKTVLIEDYETFLSEIQKIQNIGQKWVTRSEI